MKKPTILKVIAVVVLLGAVGLVAWRTFSQDGGLLGGTMNIDENTIVESYKLYTFLDATSTTAVSTNVNSTFDSSGRLDTGKLDIRGANKITFYFGRTGNSGNTGKSVFDVDVSPDGTNWYDFNKLVGNDVASTATSTWTISAATTTNNVSANLIYDTYSYVRCSVTETTDGEHTCKASVEYD